MGARLARVIRNFNVENRALKEISRTRPEPAPRHTLQHRERADAEVSEEIHMKDDPLLSRLKQIYVQSKEPLSQDSPAAGLKVEVERRPLKSVLSGEHLGMCDITEVPRGKLSIVEALIALNNHKRAPQTWTPEKIAEEYELELKDAKALTDFFIPFEVKIMPPKSESRKQIRDS